MHSRSFYPGVYAEKEVYGLASPTQVISSTLQYVIEGVSGGPAQKELPVHLKEKKIESDFIS